MANADVADEERKESFWRRRVTSPLLALLRQGATPEKLALAVALGFVIGVFPILGTTTLLCVLVAVILRLNQVAAQVGNGLASAFLFVLFIPFVRVGEWMSGDLPFPLEIRHLKAATHEGLGAFLWTFSDVLVNGMLGWAAFAPLATVALFFAILPLLRRMSVNR